VTRAPGNVERETIEVVYGDGIRTTIATSEFSEAQRYWHTILSASDRRRVEWLVWKTPGTGERYRVRATFGREPVQPHDEDCECAGRGVCEYWNTVPAGPRAE
jgi:hypothetical protein